MDETYLIEFVRDKRQISERSIRYVLSIATTLESYLHCSMYLARLSVRNKLTLLGQTVWPDIYYKVNRIPVLLQWIKRI
jgi:hypothetical protein